MTQENLEEFYTRISAMKIDDIEAYCRKTHADAVVFSFVLAFSPLTRLLQRLVNVRGNAGDPASQKAA